MKAIRVLVGEHLPLLRAGISVTIQGASDLELVGEADNGDDLANLAAEYMPEIISMDSDLPGLSQQSLIKRIKEICPIAGILLIADAVHLPSVVNYAVAGAAGCITRDASANQLLQAIRCIYSGEAVVDLAIVRDAVAILQNKASLPLVPNMLNLRELEILRLASTGLRNKAIAEQLLLSERTVHGYFRSIFSKVGVGSRTEAVCQALRNGWINLD